MEKETGKLRKYMTSEKALIIEALLAIVVSYYVLGFEITVLGALAVIVGHVVNLNLKNK